MTKRFPIGALRAATRALTFAATVLATLTLGGCIFGGGGTETEGENGMGARSLWVNVVDSTGAAFAADTVYWSYQADGIAAHKSGKSAHGSDTAHKAASRLGESGTLWEIREEGLHGAVYIRARFFRPDSANPAQCSWSAYTQHEASAAMLPATVTVTLNPKKICL